MYIYYIFYHRNSFLNRKSDSFSIPRTFLLFDSWNPRMKLWSLDKVIRFVTDVRNSNWRTVVFVVILTHDAVVRSARLIVQQKPAVFHLNISSNLCPWRHNPSKLQLKWLVLYGMFNCFVMFWILCTMDWKFIPGCVYCDKLRISDLR